MAVGTLTVFEESKAKMLEGDWASTDQFNVALMDNDVPVTAAQAAPVVTSVTVTFNQVETAGSYTAGGTSIGLLSALVTEAAGVMTFNSLEVDPTWAANASNATDASWAVVYNFTDAAKDALLYVELGTVDMVAGALTISWAAAGLFTIT